MHASPSPKPSGPDDSPQETRIHITAPEPGDSERVVARFQCEHVDGWTAAGAVSQTWRGLAITQLDLDSWIEVDNEPGHITSALLRQIPTGAIVAAAQSFIVVPPDANALAEEPPAKRQPGRQPLSDALLRTVAEHYLLETGHGMPRGAIGRLAEIFDKPPATISRWVMRARADGWLGPAVPGREGAEPGVRLLNERKRIMAEEVQAKLTKEWFTEPPEE